MHAGELKLVPVSSTGTMHYTKILISLRSLPGQINVCFSDRPKGIPGAVEMMGEVQIHLASIHAIKQQDHMNYEIRRAESISELRPQK